MTEKYFTSIIDAIRKDDKQSDQLYNELTPILSEDMLDKLFSPQKHLTNVVMDHVMNHFRDDFPSLLEEHVLGEMNPEKLFNRLLEKLGRKNFEDVNRT